MHILSTDHAEQLIEEVNQLLKISQWHQQNAMNDTDRQSNDAADAAAQLATTATELARTTPAALEAVLDEVHAGLSLLLRHPSRELVAAAYRHNSYARTRARLYTAVHGHRTADEDVA